MGAFVHSEMVPKRSCIDLGQPEGHTEQLMLRWGSPTSVLSGTGRGSRTRLQRCTCSRVVGGLSDSGINVTAAGEIWGPWGYYWAVTFIPESDNPPTTLLQVHLCSLVLLPLPVPLNTEVGEPHLNISCSV
eukprot:TRINITY_DN42059_c0_g1_i1.p1 TRINITY_DN42059_c0_g1~~TRINITY_DN42059_c0_g1_i1.p1  ORF type:complete len:131 (+),score=21.59 TRINITY_DN42059_c0_g1_i1:276-668(+)